MKNRWFVRGAVLVSFAAGSVITPQLTHLSQARADGNRVFELLVYSTVPGKVPALESIFRDVARVDEVYMRPTDYSALR